MTPRDGVTPSNFDFLAHRGEMARLIAAFDWSGTPLGVPAQWPQVLKSTIALILQSPVPIVTLWGEDGIMLYNDAYSEFAGARHPALLGSKVREGWEEVADFNDNVMRVGLAGGTLAYRDQELTLYREGRSHQAWLNLDYSPIMGADGRPVGVMAIVVETTGKVRAERWRKGEQERLRQMFEQAPGFIAMMRGPDHVFDLVNQAYLQLVEHREVIGKPVREALSDLRGQDFYELLDRVYASGEPHSAIAMPVHLAPASGGPTETKFVDLVYQPVTDQDGVVIGIFVQGTDVTERVAAEEALRASEQQSRQILDGAVDYVILALSLDGIVLRWNEGAHRIFGWAEEDVLGRHWEMLFTPEDRLSGKPQEAMDAAMRLGTAHHERWHLRKNGEAFWASGEISPILDGAGKPIGLVKVLRDHTAEHLAASAMRELEARLRRAQEAGGVGLFSLNLETSILVPTPEFCKIYGVPYAEALPISVIEELVFPSDRDIASNSDSRRDGHSPLNVEYRIRRADNGQKRVIARKGEFERDEQGNLVRFVGVVQDVTEQRRAQQELRESEARFRALTQAIPNHVWTARPDGKADWFNERVYNYTGCKAEELIEDGWARVMHPDDSAAAEERWQACLRSGEVYQAEFRLRDRHGGYRWHIARAVPIRAEEGRIVRWIGTNTDIGELRATREKLEALNRTLEQRVAERTADRDRMWRLSTDIMLVAAFDSRITAINPAWKAVLGWEEGDLIGQSFMDMIHPDDYQATLHEVSKLGSGLTTFLFENRYRCKDGSYRMISWTAVPDEGFIHAVGRDVTEERAAAETLRRTEAALQQAQKMEAIGNLTGGVAHDFNNLLQVIAGNLQLLSKDVSGNERAARRITSALEGVSRGSKLAAQLLAFGRRQALDPRVVSIGRLIRGMDEMLRRTIGEGVEIETIVSGGLWNTLIDPMQLENALLNLAINARDAMDGFGKLTIEAGNAYLDDAYARLNDDVQPGQYVVLSVTDTGSGMSADIVEKVFEPFFSTKPEGKGTGLGLSMVYGFVKQSGGHVKLYSEVGHGTTVKIYLPRSLQVEDVEVQRLDAPIEGGAEIILVAEDDAGVRATVVEMLQDLGYRVLKASDAAAALSIVESGLTIDLLFTDVVMPGSLKSADLARKARERQPQMAVLFTSGYTENSIVHGGRLDPDVQLLSKPYTREALARKIRHVLDANKQRLAKPKPPAPEQAGPPPVSGLRVLVVEDDALIRMNTADMLADLGHACLEAASGDEALKLLESNSVDVLLTDLGLPGMDGETLARQVRQTWPAVAIVFATGSDAAPTLPGPSPATWLGKPFGVTELDAALRRVADRPRSPADVN
ncbi:PAS domain S-box protein [Rhizobium sp. YJ-22]|uniref:hybrid sensor histidine kinase/response regulator n=1 Tax=Rhizobium sp. YJ-22 TaxID=3037556 RepID=UPI0024125BC7|nr:PAS domain S-box protein [Rhizobium sp. YJ-22]MDG3577818.1 PAS domain S-box protein [Rhizobium sp. YJ-22]